MRRRKIRRKTGKARRQKALKPRSASIAGRHRSPVGGGEKTNSAQFRRERDEALEQLVATSEVLGIIRRSPTDAQPVFDAIVESAARLCGAIFSISYLYDGDRLRVAATKGFTTEATRRVQEQNQRRPQRSHLGGRAILDRAVVHVADVLADPEYSREYALAGGWRAVLAVPLLRDGVPLGALSVAKAEPTPFSDRQIQLLKTFADQAVIAIENTRLLNELRESLQQQTATSEVLKIISSSPGELEPVFQAMLEQGTRVCDAKFGILYLRDGDAFNAVATTRDAPPAYVEMRKKERRLQPAPDGPVGQVVATRQAVQIPDFRELKSYREGHRFVVTAVELGGFRTALGVPLLRDNELVGAISIMRQEVRPFTDKQVELVQNFAAQAVIALENARLLNELRESLEQQTATAEVLKVISSSPGELEPVFNALVANATRICEASFGNLFLSEGPVFCAVAVHNENEYLRRRRVIDVRENPGTPLDRLEKTKQVVHVTDLRSDESYIGGNQFIIALADVVGARSFVAVPMVKEGKLVGSINMYRQEVRPFTDKQIELVQNFAAQAVIAIENTRLLNELRESLQQQTATADVLRVISSSPGNLEPVFQAILENATQICQARFGTLNLCEGDALRRVALHNPPPQYAVRQGEVFQPHPAGGLGRVLQTKQIAHIEDIRISQPYLEGDRAVTALVDLAGARTVLVVPMLKKGEPVGAVTLYRQEVRPFTDKQIELVSNFAAQAVIAIENTRLLNELRERTHELAASLDNLRTTQDRLVQTQKLALLGQLTAGIAHEIKNPLNFVNNFSGISAELIDELQDTLKGIPLNDKARTELNELTNTLKGNFDKVVHHGRRADAIVKNMLQHSREGTGEHRAININALVEESLNLAWHGARAETQGFEIKLRQSFDPSAGEADVFPQDIRRALLNMISNGFYAASRRRAETNGGDYEPTLTASTKSLGDQVEIRIRDNGTGMTPDVKEKMFNPFFTTKPTGEGTGLGLSISHDIIVKQHGGSIEVETQPGEFTEIRVVLPRAAALLPERP